MWRSFSDHTLTPRPSASSGIPTIAVRFALVTDLAGTLTALAGGTLKIQARLGHSSPEAAMIYQHVAQGRDGVVASEIDRIISAASATGGS